jgi:hypothetical protein
MFVIASASRWRTAQSLNSMAGPAINMRSPAGEPMICQARTGTPSIASWSANGRCISQPPRDSACFRHR